MGYGGHHFAAAPGGQVGENEVNDRPANVGKRVAIEEQERGAAMALPQELYGFGKGTDSGLAVPPLCFNRCMALRILAVLRSSSCARCSVEAGDKLPTPVFEKSGSGL